MTPIPDSSLGTGTALRDGIAVVGSQLSRDGYPPALWRPLRGGTWGVEPIAGGAHWARAMTELGDTQVVVGVDPREQGSTDPVVSWAAAREHGGEWVFSDLGALSGGMSTEVWSIGLTGSPADENSAFVVVGVTADPPPTEQFTNSDLSGALPFVALSPNGVDWEQAADLPLPAGVTNAVATALTYAAEGTPYPGLIVVGYGIADDEALPERRRWVGIVWLSTDVGQSWEVISDDNFDEPGRNITAIRVAADDNQLVVGGRADVPGAEHTGENVQQETVLWTLGTDGSWTLTSDGPGLRETRSSRLTALGALEAGGFVAVSQVYDTAVGMTLMNGDIIGDPSMQVLSGSDANSLQNVTESVAEIDRGAVFQSVVEFGHSVVFFGMDTSGNGAAWTVDSSSLE